MTPIEVHLDLDGRAQPLGLLRRQSSRRGEAITFEYDPAWLADARRFAIDPTLPLTPGIFAPPAGRALFGAIGDSAPDTWGRRLMQRAERRTAKNEKRPVRPFNELDYLLDVTDTARMGALRFRRQGEREFQAASREGIPSLVDLGRLLQITERLLRDEETEEDFRLILAPGSSLGGARPKASVIDPHGYLSIAKFPRENDEYSIETWEEIALRLAEQAGIETPRHKLLAVAETPVLLSRRFDRVGGKRIPFLSAMSMTGARDGERGSYPELVDVLASLGARAKADAAQLYRRVAFNVLVSNVDDHLRNHGFLWAGAGGWILSPAYDLNPTPIDEKARILATNIDLDEGTCSVELLEGAAAYFGLSPALARAIIREVAQVTRLWRAAAREVGARTAEIERMASAFEHDDLQAALKL
jgi:serine/threonine-protein kinase HipA